MRKILTVFLTVFLLVSLPLFSINYYVKNDGNDGLDGQSDGNAWATVTKVNTEMNGGVIAQSDDVYFKRGSTWDGQDLVIRVGGTALDIMTIGYYDAGDKPLFTDLQFDVAQGVDYVTIENLKFQDHAQHRRTLGGDGDGDWITNLTIQNVDFVDCYNSIVLQGVDTFTIDSVTLDNDDTTHNGILVRGSPTRPITNGTIKNCDVNHRGEEDGLSIHEEVGAGTPPAGANFTVEDNEIYNGQEEGMDLTSGDNITASDNYTHDNAKASIVFGHSVKNVTVERHLSEDDGGGFDFNKMGDATATITIKNSIIYGIDNANYCILEVDASTDNDIGDIEVYYNTFIATAAMGERQTVKISGGSDIASFTFKNNICTSLVADKPTSFVRLSGGATLANTSSDFDNNHYYQTDNDSTKTLWDGENFTDWKANAEVGANEQFGNPQLVDPANGDYKIQQFSQCIDNGVDVGIAEDYIETARPDGDGYDIGAYEYLSGNGNGSGICPESFTHYKIITVQGGNLSNNQTNVPVMFKSKVGGDTDIGAGTDDIDDIWFYTDASPPVKLSWDPIYYNNAAGTVTFISYVNCSPLANGTYTVRAYYGDMGAADGSDPGGTYNANYKAVYHLDEESGNRSDSSGNNNTLVDTNTVLFGAGKVYNAADFEYDNDEYLLITDGNQTGLDITGDISMSAWAKFETLPQDTTRDVEIAGKTKNAVGRSWRFWGENDDDTFRFKATDDGSDAAGHKTVLDSTTTLSTSWQHIACAVDISVPSATFWFDGSSEVAGVTSSNATSINDGSHDFVLGGDYHPGDDGELDGMLDEVRIYSGLYPTGWVVFEYANMNEADNELTWGSETACSEEFTPNPTFFGLNFSCLLIMILGINAFRRRC